MKRLLVLAICSFFAIPLFAQTQTEITTTATSTSSSTNTNNNNNTNNTTYTGTSTNTNTNTNNSTINTTTDSTSLNTNVNSMNYNGLIENINTSTSNNTNTNTNNTVSTSSATNVNTNNTTSNTTSNSTSFTTTNSVSDITAINTNNNLNDTVSRSTQRVTQKLESPPPSAIAPSIGSSYSQDLCTKGISGAVQTQILGLSTGRSVRDTNCERIKLGKTLYDMGMRVAAVSLMCQDYRVWSSMMSAGTPCPYEGKIGDEAKALWEANPDKIPEPDKRVR